MQFEQTVKQKALELGFDVAGIAPAAESPHQGYFRDWLAAGKQAGMDWLARMPERRCDPRKVLPGARSVVLVGISYFTEEPPDGIWNDPLRGRIARFAWGPDYHDVIVPRLRQLAEFIDGEVSPETPSRAYADYGPVLERSSAQLAGIGSPGYSTNLIVPGFGSYVLLGEIVTAADLEPDCPAAPITDHCEACRACLQACPTGALDAPYSCDSRRCISYLTIEHKGLVPLDLRPLLANWIFGCDDCQTCCPHVAALRPPREHQFLEYQPQNCAPWLSDVLQMEEDEFRRRFRGTPVARRKRAGLARNAAVALGNSGDRGALPALKRALLAEEDPVLREHIAWAIENIAKPPPLPPRLRPDDR